LRAGAWLNLAGYLLLFTLLAETDDLAKKPEMRACNDPVGMVWWRRGGVV
jgi:hypothetical protein